MEDLERLVKVDGYTFKYDKENNMYECRGEVMYDDEHDEMPEPNLWNAAKILRNRLVNDGHNAEVEHSEKGWVEVVIL